MDSLKRFQGFTLIELLVVISIVALLSSVVMTSLSAARVKAAKATGLRFSASTYNIMGDQAVGVWDFDECSGNTVADKSGTGNAGTLQSGASWSATSPTSIGCSLSLDGIDDYVSVSSDEISDAEGSIFAWAYPTATAANAYVFQGNSDSGTNRLYLQWNTNFIATRSNPAVSIIIKANPTLNMWHHVGLSWKNGVFSAYYNGTFVGSSAFTPVGTGWTTSYIGQQGGGARNFPGLIDEVRVYSRSLTSAEVGQMYADGMDNRKFSKKP